MTILSTDYLSVEFLIQEKFGGSTQIVTLGQSLFIIGTAVRYLISLASIPKGPDSLFIGRTGSFGAGQRLAWSVSPRFAFGAMVLIWLLGQAENGFTLAQLPCTRWSTS